MRQRHGHAWREGDTLALAIGQGELTATPLQVARLMAAVANGGRLVKPHAALRLGMAASDVDGASDSDNATPLGVAVGEPIDGLHPATLEAVRRGLEQVVADPAGTGHRTVYCQTIDIAGKTGTAETGGDREDHAWFAGYAPAESPVVAFAVALEHAGSGGDVAGPIAKRLVQKMELLGYFRRVRVASQVRRESEDLASDAAEAPACRTGAGDAERFSERVLTTPRQNDARRRPRQQTRHRTAVLGGACIAPYDQVK